MKIALNLNSYEIPQLTRVLPFVKDLGIGAVELWGCCLQENGKPGHPYSYANKDLSSGLQLLEQYGMEICVLTFGLGLDPAQAQDPAAFSRELCDTIALAASLGAPTVIHHMCGITDAPDPQIATLRPYWEPAVEAAEARGVVLALENEATDATWCPENTLQILQSFPSRFFTANFDSGNYYFGGNEAFPHGYRLLRGRIGHVHMKGYCVYDPADCPREEMRCASPMAHRFAGLPAYRCGGESGGANNDGLLRALAEDGYTGYVSLEHHGSDEGLNELFANSAAWLRATGLFEG